MDVKSVEKETSVSTGEAILQSTLNAKPASETMDSAGVQTKSAIDGELLVQSMSKSMEKYVGKTV